MALVETAGAAYKQSSTAVLALASYTPAANALIVLAIGVGNGNGITATSMTPTDTFGGTATGAWVRLVQFLPTTSAGGAGIWVKDAGSGPTAGIITMTVAPSTVLDVAGISRNFAGALAAASQNGATGTASGTVSTVSVTAHATGSQIVGGFGIDSGTTRTANAATTFYGQTTGGAGDQEGVFEGSALTTASVAQVLGYTATQAQSGLAAAEILAAVSSSFIPTNVIVGNQAVKRGAFYCFPPKKGWKDRASGLLVRAI